MPICSFWRKLAHPVTHFDVSWPKYVKKSQRGCQIRQKKSPRTPKWSPKSRWYPATSLALAWPGLRLLWAARSALSCHIPLYSKLKRYALRALWHALGSLLRLHLDALRVTHFDVSLPNACDSFRRKFVQIRQKSQRGGQIRQKESRRTARWLFWRKLAQMGAPHLRQKSKLTSEKANLRQKSFTYMNSYEFIWILMISYDFLLLPILACSWIFLHILECSYAFINILVYS